MRGKAGVRVVLTLLVALAGCASMQFGAPLRIDRIDSLTPKVSLKSDVLLALGEPSGTGAMRFNPQIARRDVWFYEHLNVDSSLVGSSQKVTILLVFFDGDRYDGHYWFGEQQRMGPR